MERLFGLCVHHLTGFSAAHEISKDEKGHEGRPATKGRQVPFILTIGEKNAPTSARSLREGTTERPRPARVPSGCVGGS